VLRAAEKMVATDEKTHPEKQAALNQMEFSLSPCQVRLPKTNEQLSVGHCGRVVVINRVRLDRRRMVLR